MNPEQQTPKDSLPAPSVDDLIAHANAEAYVFEHGTQKRSVKDWFLGLSRIRKVLLIGGTIGVIFIATVVGISLGSNGSNGAKSGTALSYATTDTNGDGVIDEKDEVTTVKGDTNGDGVVDSRDDASANTTDSSSASWWSNLFSKASSAIQANSSSSDESDDDTATASTSSSDTSKTSDDTDSGYEDDAEWYDTDNEGDSAFDDDTTDFSSYGDTDQIDDTISANVSHPITIASWNTMFNNSTSNVAKGAKAVAKKTDIIGFQELHLSDRRKAMRDAILCSSCDFTGYIKDYSVNGSSPSSVGIVWRKDRFKKLDAGYRKVSSTQYIKTHTGITGNKVSAKWITWVKLKDKQTGKEFYMMNTHTVASLESKGKPMKGEGDRVDNYAHHMDVLTSLVNQLKADGLPIFITGDFNVNYRYDSRVKYKDFPYARLRTIDVRSDYQRLKMAGISSHKGSHGSGTRIIDYVWSLDSPELVSSSMSISSVRYGSDHYPVFYTFGVQ